MQIFEELRDWNTRPEQKPLRAEAVVCINLWHECTFCWCSAFIWTSFTFLKITSQHPENRAPRCLTVVMLCHQVWVWLAITSRAWYKWTWYQRFKNGMDDDAFISSIPLGTHGNWKVLRWGPAPVSRVKRLNLPLWSGFYMRFSTYHTSVRKI